MKFRKLFSLLLATMLALACNFPLFAPVTPTADNSSIEATESATALATFFPTFTPIPPSPTVTGTPGIPQVTANSTAVNCRSGPGSAYSVKDTINVGQSAQIKGKNGDGSWWYVQDPNNANILCWVSDSVVRTAGNVSDIIMVTPSTGVVVSVKVEASVSSPVYCGGPNAVMFSGTITTDGPAKVQYQWEIRGDKSNTTSPQTINFKSAATKSVPDPGAYSTDCGNYSVTLHVLSPNDFSATKKFSVAP